MDEQEPEGDESDQLEEPTRPAIVSNTFMRQRDDHILTVVGMVIGLLVVLLMSNC